MSLLVDAATLDARRAIARGALAPLAHGLHAELAPVLAGAIEIPTEKALLSREGGRCPRDGTLLRFDPLDARHRCPACGLEVTGELHDRFRPYSYQLWLAERVLHAAVLGALLEDDDCTAAAWRVLDAYAERYLGYSNRDNVLGPSRPFFSTYLESIWLLQLVLALDLLEMAPLSDAVSSGRIRDHLIEPSAALVASYDEGLSNRQVWNDAAMLAAGASLHDRRLIDRALDGPSGLRVLLTRALLDDGSWYEGENYHLFAHRGLWYAVTLAERMGRAPAPDLVRRFDSGFAAPFRTLLPDLTYPSRRDSQYAVSIRQPRFAESCELGLARHDDPRLVSILARLYDPSVPVRDTGRRASTADVERNLPATGLSRADLSWRSLLFARESLPPLVAHPFGSDLLPAQGFGILRRESDRIFAGLDYGRSGGGHGHPDRLDLLLSDGDARWFDDPGTGSYVDESLHWYRSTLAHTAPMLDGHSQPRVDGRLEAFDDRPGAGWMSASAELAPDCVVRRSVIVMEDYLVDLVEWEGEAAHELALPLHGVVVLGEDDALLLGVAEAIEGGGAREDGFTFLERTARLAPATSPAPLRGVPSAHASRALDGWLSTSGPATWWSAVAPGPPGRPPQPMVLVRQRARRGSIVGVWSWRGAIRSVEVNPGTVVVHRTDGETHRHESRSHGWRVAVESTRAAIELGTGAARDSDTVMRPSDSGITKGPQSISRAQPLPRRVTLGAEHYRRSEQSWEEAGRPTASVALRAAGDRLVVEVVVPRRTRFVAIDARNPFDNDPAAIHGDGVQLYVEAGQRAAGWLLVPNPGAPSVGRRVTEGWEDALPLDASWSPLDDGYALRAEIALPPATREVCVDVLINETAPDRARRRGQLVLSGAIGEFVYLRSDRHERDRLLRFELPDGGATE